MGIKWSELSERQKALIDPASMPLERTQMASERVLPPLGSVATTRLEKAEQGTFAQWCLLHELPFVWHATHAPSKATPGTPDFIVGAAGKTLWIEFKRLEAGQRLSSAQEAFKSRLARQNIALHVLTSAAQAIELLKNCIS